jgi:hypothetical protein
MISVLCQSCKIELLVSGAMEFEPPATYLKVEPSVDQS